MLPARSVPALDRHGPSAGSLWAQAPPKAEEEIPAQVQGWADAAKSASDKGQMAEALRLQLQVVEWVSSRLRPVHPVRADALNNLGLILNAAGRPEEALKPTQEAVQIYRQLAESNSVYLGELAMALNNLGLFYGSVGRQQEALNPAQEAVKTFRKLAQTNSDQLDGLAFSLNNLGKVLIELGQRQEALPPMEEAVQIYRKLTEVNPDYRGTLAMALTNLGVTYGSVGRQHEALKPTQEGVQILRALAQINPAYLGLLALALSNQGQALIALGQREEALRPLEESVQITRKLVEINPGNRGALAMALTNLGLYYASVGRYLEALKPTAEVVNITRELTTINPVFASNLTIALSNLSSIYVALGRQQEALKPTQEAIVIIRKFAKDNPAYLANLALTLTNLGSSYASVGSTREALKPTQEAIEITRKLAQTNPLYLGNLALALKNLGSIYDALALRQEALKSTKEAVEISRQLANANPAYLDLMADGATSLANLLIQQGNAAAALPLVQEAVISEVSLLQRQLPLMPEGRRQELVATLGDRWQLPFSLSGLGEQAAALALFTRLNRHGPLHDIERRQGLLARAPGAMRQLVDRLTALTAELANPSLAVERRQQALADSEQLQRELFRQLPALQPRQVEIAQVARGLPADGALVEFQRYAPYNPRQRSGNGWDSPRYLAMVLHANGKLAAVDLGEAEPLEAAIASALDRTMRQDPLAAQAWAQVAEKVFAPLQSQLAGLSHVLISPDGQLHRVPFSALELLAGNGRALPAGATLQTIGSGRDLVSLAAAQSKPTAPLVLANPTTIGWPVLARAQNEGQAVASSLGVSANLGPAATVRLLEQARGPRVLHVAAHGYFNPQDSSNTEAKGDPLLASGLVLAGADKARQPGPQRPSSSSGSGASPPLALPANPTLDDGYLTAKEAARLQLEGTELVVLSACETGRGDYRTGEGLFGLQRALSVAGARGTLLSLWKVPEHATETFMARFYTLLRQGVPPAEAVRRVQAEFRSQPRIDGWSDPYYWAGWQYSGPPDHLK